MVFTFHTHRAQLSLAQQRQNHLSASYNILESLPRKSLGTPQFLSQTPLLFARVVIFVSLLPLPNILTLCPVSDC